MEFEPASFSSGSELRRSWRRLRLGAALGFFTAGLAAAPLAETSPFLGAGAAGIPAGIPGNATLELRGIMTGTTAARFCIYDPARRISVWSELNESGHGFVIKSADLLDDSVMVETGGRTLRLVLHRAQITALGSADSAAFPVPPAESALDQTRRIQDAAEAVRLRRVQREQMALRQAADRSGSPGDAAPR